MTDPSRKTGFKISTFNDARRQHRPLSDGEIRALLRMTVDNYSWGKEVEGYSGGVEGFLGRADADASDVEFGESPELKKQYRRDLTSLIVDKMKIGIAPNVPQQIRDFLSSIKEGWFKKIRSDDDVWAAAVDYFHGIESGKPTNLQDIRGYTGLSVPTSAGDVDLFSRGGITGIRSNMKLMDQIATRWFAWESATFNEQRISGTAPHDMDVRIYLNPQIKDHVRIFREVIDEVEQVDGMIVRGKIADHSSDRKGTDKQVRADGIILYTTSQDADKLLEIVRRVWQRNQTTFVGRKTPRVTTEIADGVSLGDESRVSGESLISERANMINEVGRTAWSKLREMGVDEKDPRAKQIFLKVLGKVATKNGVNPSNLAFYL